MMNRRHKVCYDKTLLCRNIAYFNMEKLVEIEEELRKKTYRDKKMYVATLKEEVSGCDR